MQVVGTSLDEHTRESFIELARKAIEEFSDDAQDKQEFDEFAKRLFWAAPGWTTCRPRSPRRRPGCDQQHSRLHYLSVPPKCGARGGAHAAATPGLVENSRIVMEKPFGTDLESARGR